MARVTHVKKAQQRYATVKVLNEDGSVKQTPVMKTIKDYVTGETTQVQKTTKRGVKVFMTVTAQDRTKPLPMPECDYSGCKHEQRAIKVGEAYKHITPKSGPYGGRTRVRHEDCPTWMVWEYSSSLSARTAEISHNAWSAFPDSAESADDIESWLEDVASEIEALADEKDESADNIEEGFGHETSASEELREVAENLRSWADDVRSADLPDFPEPEEEDCDDCEGNGTKTEECVYCSGTGLLAETVEGDEDTDPEEECSQCGGEGEADEDCDTCDGTGTVTPEEPSEEQISNWLDEVRDAVSIVDECPV